MTDALQVYRDDGPLAQSVRALAPAGRLGSSVLAGVGLLLLAAGLALDGQATGVWTVAGLALYILLAAAGGAGDGQPRLRWLTPPLLRAAEMGYISVLGARGGDDVLPFTYALLAAVAFHHYDVVYRLRHQRVPPPAWLGRLGLGWDGRMILITLLAVTNVVGTGDAILAGALGALFVAESVVSWVRLARAPERVIALDEDEEDV